MILVGINKALQHGKSSILQMNASFDLKTRSAFVGESVRVWSKMYHNPSEDSRRDNARAIPSRSTISFFFCFRSRYRQPGRATRSRRLWQDGLLREARYARTARSKTRLYDCTLQSLANSGRPISNSASALENAICHSTCRPDARVFGRTRPEVCPSVSIGNFRYVTLHAFLRQSREEESEVWKWMSKSLKKNRQSLLRWRYQLPFSLICLV